jgi:hypothetical protein
MHVMVTVCRPAAWLKDTRTFSPLSIHLPYKAEKSAAEMGGSGLGQVSSPTLVTTPPLTTLAHVGEAREVGGGEGFTCWGLACRADTPSTPEEGEAEWRGAKTKKMIYRPWNIFPKHFKLLLAICYQTKDKSYMTYPLRVRVNSEAVVCIIFQWLGLGRM